MAVYDASFPLCGPICAKMAADHCHGYPVGKFMFENGSVSMQLQMAIAEGTMLQIEALSESINNLTYLLSRDELQKELRRSQTALV